VVQSPSSWTGQGVTVLDALLCTWGARMDGTLYSGPDIKKRLPRGSFVKNVFQKSQNKKNYTFHLQTTFLAFLALGQKVAEISICKRGPTFQQGSLQNRMVTNNPFVQLIFSLSLLSPLSPWQLPIQISPTCRQPRAPPHITATSLLLLRRFPARGSLLPPAVTARPRRPRRRTRRDAPPPGVPPDER
jgi:hypothetical protein